MDITVQTGVTKSVNGTTLVALPFTSKDKEQVLLLLHVHADPKAAKTLEEECSMIVQHALLDTEGESWHRLDGALKEFNGLMKGLIAAQAVDEVHAVVALVDSTGMLHVSTAGRGEAYLVRGGTASQITEFSKGKPVSAFIHIASGPMEDQDAVVFSTQRVLRALTPAQLAQVALRRDGAIDTIVGTMDDERESAAMGVLHMGDASQHLSDTPPVRQHTLPSRRSGARGTSRLSLPSSFSRIDFKKFGQAVLPVIAAWSRKGLEKISSSSGHVQTVREKATQFFADLKDPQRKRRAHFLLIAGVLAAFLIIFLVVKLSTSSQRSKTRAELGTLVQKINEELRTADNKRLAGDTDAANTVLQQADAWAKQVMDNESGLFRVEALDLLDRIRSKREEINNILRVSPRVVVNLSSKNADVAAQGLIGVADGEFIAYDREDWYHVLLNGVDDPKKLSDDGMIIDGTDFSRYKSQVFATTGNAIIELQGNQPVSMKTEDPAGWVTGKEIKTYLRYLYVLTTDNKIFKYERMSNRYGIAAPYNINGDLTGALDMAIDSSIYVLKEDGTIVKLMRGESKPFAIRHAPDDTFKNATKIVKIADANFYFLDPTKSRVIVASDGGATGESSYLKQYVLEGDQIGKLQDLYVDPEESHLYVVDEKRIYVVDLVK